MKKAIIIAVVAVLAASCGGDTKQQEWISLFNGKDLTGWTVKITGYPAGENFGNTFRVEDGLLKVRYDRYDQFNNRFGHIYTNEKFSDYRLRVEYRFVGEQATGGEGWAWRNSGAMLHCPDPATMSLDQYFPVSIEAQMLGGDGQNERTTANVCTPGTEIDMNGEPYKIHCCNSNSKTYHGDQWVALELIVYGDSLVHHVMDGDTVLTYTNLRVDDEGAAMAPGLSPGPLSEGHIALQSESHPIDFRKVEIMPLNR